ncbi:MAG: PH domain-containing protein [Acidiferrobacterales bacterium]
MTYPSKKDPWIVLLVVVPGLALVGVAIYHVSVQGLSDPATWSVLGSALFYVGIILALAYPVDYEITRSSLRIRSGLLRFEIPLSAIERVRPTRNPLSAPAWSLDRLRIDYRQNGRSRLALISPENKTSFLRALAQRTESLELQGNELVRKARSENA